MGLALFAGGWVLTGFANTIPFLYVAYGVIAGAGAGMIYPACLPTALKWFPDKSGSISGLVRLELHVDHSLCHQWLRCLSLHMVHRLHVRFLV